MDFDFDRFVEVENVINAIFNGFPVHFDPDGPQMPSVPGLQQRSSTPSTSDSSSSASSSASTSTAASSAPSSATSTSMSMAAFAPTSSAAASVMASPSMSTPTMSFVKRVGSVGIEPPSWSSPAAYLADKRACSASLEIKPSVDLDTIEKLLFPTDLDGSSAIALSRRLGADGKRSHALAFGSDDSFLHRPRKFMTVDDACRIPHKAVRDELVKLYFQYFHPFCPVVDEYDFMQVYDKIEDEELLGKSIELPLFQAMMFVAFGHISPVRLLSTPFKSVYEGQRAYFDKASLLYRINYTSDQLVLTKVALLLTFWSPFDSEYQVNSYWVDRAFIHARAMKLWEPQPETSSSRHRIVWWCCLLRDRMISFALRRSYRIQEAKSTWPLVNISDFGLEVMFPRFMDAKTKRTTLEAFICLCDLTDIIRDIAVFHENNSFDREWSGGLIEKASIIPQITQVSQFDNRLKNWKEIYLKLAGDYIKSLIPRSCRMPNYVLIVGDSVLATLYLPYIHCPSGSIPIVQRFQKFSLGRLKAASSMVALHVRNLNSSTKIEEEIIVGIIAWIGLPMAVFKVLSELDSRLPDEASTGRFADFVPLLSSLATRFHAAKVLSDMMGEATNQIVERSFKLGIARKDTQHRVPDRQNVKPAEVVHRSKDVDEAEILNCVAKMVDLRFSTDGLK